MSEEEGRAGVSAPSVKVSELGPYSKQVNTTVKVVQKGEARETVSRQDGTTHRVLDALVGGEEEAADAAEEAVAEDTVGVEAEAATAEAEAVAEDTAADEAADATDTRN